MNTDNKKTVDVIDLEGYKIVIPARSDESFVEMIAYELKEFLAALGNELQVISDAECICAKEIRIGKTNRTTADAPNDLCYEIATESNGAIRILASSAYGYDDAMNHIRMWGGIPQNVCFKSDASSLLYTTDAQHHTDYIL